MNNSKPINKNSKSTSTTSPTKLSNAPFILLIILAFIILAYQWFKYNKKITDMSAFTNQTDIPYIAQSVYINIYATPSDYPNYQWLFKGTLTNSILVTNGTDYVMVPRTVRNIPINVYSNSPTTRFTITANGIEQPIQLCDFLATTY